MTHWKTNVHIYADISPITITRIGLISVYKNVDPLEATYSTKTKQHITSWEQTIYNMLSFPGHYLEPSNPATNGHLQQITSGPLSSSVRSFWCQINRCNRDYRVLLEWNYCSVVIPEAAATAAAAVVVVVVVVVIIVVIDIVVVMVVVAAQAKWFPVQ